MDPQVSFVVFYAKKKLYRRLLFGKKRPDYRPYDPQTFTKTFNMASSTPTQALVRVCTTLAPPSSCQITLTNDEWDFEALSQVCGRKSAEVYGLIRDDESCRTVLKECLSGQNVRMISADMTRYFWSEKCEAPDVDICIASLTNFRAMIATSHYYAPNYMGSMTQYSFPGGLGAAITAREHLKCIYHRLLSMVPTHNEEALATARAGSMIHLERANEAASKHLEDFAAMLANGVDRAAAIELLKVHGINLEGHQGRLKGPLVYQAMQGASEKTQIAIMKHSEGWGMPLPEPVRRELARVRISRSYWWQ
ncbi:unnamed protein product [Pelagomonas calceolata]|uniref:Uncharacterized protein n=1 Tax=Pelagomonas calceolata TaxID=35677 RepID=A0A8J2WIZ3_9STRA|nr:unnamed protein product [Pelagomonas calceolata]